MNKSNIDAEGLEKVVITKTGDVKPAATGKHSLTIEPAPPQAAEPEQPAIKLTTKMVRPLIDGIAGMLENRFGQEFHYIESSKESIAVALIPVLEKYSTEALTKYGAELGLFLIVFGETYPRVVARNKRLAREQMAGESDPDKLEPFVPQVVPEKKPPAKKTATKKPVKRKARKDKGKKRPPGTSPVGKPFQKRSPDGTYAPNGS